jgi:hypothetical protein
MKITVFVIALALAAAGSVAVAGIAPSCAVQKQLTEREQRKYRQPDRNHKVTSATLALPRKAGVYYRCLFVSVRFDVSRAHCHAW